MRLTLALLLVLAATPAVADTLAPDAPVVTATASPPMSVADQVDHYLMTSPALGDVEDARVAIAREDRRPHGEIAVGIGTHGYRSFYARTDIPLGETGRLSVAVGQGRFPGGFSGWDDQPYRALRAGPGERQRCDLEIMTPQRSLDRFGGPHGRCRADLTR